MSLRRIEHGYIARDIIIEGERAFPRQRAKPMLTSWHVRKRMIDELAERPEGYRKRSLAKRLTRLDKALTDLEAYSLDRAFSAWLVTAGKSHSVDVSGSGIRGNEQAEPLNEAELKEVGQYQAGLRAMFKDAYHCRMVEQTADGFFRQMAPWAEQPFIPNLIQLRMLVALARQLQRIYVHDFNKGA